MNNTRLSRDDLVCLTEAVKSNKLPQLEYLHLERNNLSSMEDEVGNLIQVCVVLSKTTIFPMSVFVRHTQLSEDFCDRMKSLFKGKKIQLFIN